MAICSLEWIRCIVNCKSFVQTCIFSFRCRYMPILNKAISMSGVEPKRCIIYQRNGLETASLQTGRDVSWDEALSGSQLHDCVPVESNEPMYILYTSGTTGNASIIYSFIKVIPKQDMCYASFTYCSSSLFANQFILCSVFIFRELFRYIAISFILRERRVMLTWASI